ncbi:MAG TPA: tetratricopeptide repeat protein [Acidobacteriaceae bacterium]|nr:tetratricopeptide repeat protein [Acidobacteriaceae bacterium]
MHFLKLFPLFSQRKRVICALVSIAILLCCAPSRAADLEPATRAVLHGEADSAISLLRPIIASEPDNGEAHLLLCRVFYAEERPTAAVPECDAALRTLSNNSEAQDWAGRVYGLQADKAGPITGLRMAFKVRQAFEAAVRLDAQNGVAVNDLSEYYIDAPAVVGGGYDKAAQLADRSAARLPQNAHRIRALSAEHQKDFGTAEREFRAAAAVADRPDAWADLGAFYERREQYDRATEALQHAIAVDRAHDSSLVDAATSLTEIHREPAVAEHAFRDYLVSHAQSDAAPAFRVHLELGKLLRSQGRKAEAKIEVQKALALASGYAPARHELAGL